MLHLVSRPAYVSMYLCVCNYLDTKSVSDGLVHVSTQQPVASPFFVHAIISLNKYNLLDLIRNHMMMIQSHHYCTFLEDTSDDPL